MWWASLWGKAVIGGMTLARIAFIESNTTGSGRLFARAAVGMVSNP